MANSRGRTRISRSRSSEETADDLREVIVELRSELELERKCVRRLRREKAFEIQLAREQEQNRAVISMREMTAKLHQTKEQENEVLRCRHKADIDKVAKQKDKELNRTKKDLAKCQEDLKEEIHRRGLSASARAAFELERPKLLQEIKDLNVAKKQLEDSLHAASESAKQRGAELRLIQETTQNEIAKINREANIEVKRLLEELKTKDRSTMVKTERNVQNRLTTNPQTESQSVCLSEGSGLSKEIEALAKKFSTVKEALETTNNRGNHQNLSLQRKLYEIEKQLRAMESFNSGFTQQNSALASVNSSLEQKIKSVMKQNKALNTEVRSAKGEIKRLKDLMNSTGISDLTLTLEDLCKQIKDYETKANGDGKPKVKKTVRFLLPNEEKELSCDVDGRFTVFDDGGGGGGDITGGDREGKRQGRTSNLVQLAQQSQTDASTNGTSHQEELKIQNESLKIVIETLEEKLRNCEINEQQLELKLKEICDQNEDLEFQILELENGTDEKKLHWQKENEMLKSELSVLKNQSSYITERNVATQCDENMIANELLKLQNPLHGLTDDHKISAAVKPRNAGVERRFSNSGPMAHDGCGDETPSAELMRMIEILKRKLARSQSCEKQMKDQLMLLEEEKNRHIKLLQQQIEALEDPSSCSVNSTHLQGSDGKEMGITSDSERPNPEGLECETEDIFACHDRSGSTMKRNIKLKLDTTLHWTVCPIDVFNSTPVSGDCLFNPQFGRKDSREEQLCRQIAELERERDVLQETIHCNENVIQELHTEIDKLLQSEKELQRIVTRLEIAEEKLRSKMTDMTNQNDDMEEQIKQFKESENILLSKLTKFRSTEMELNAKINEVVEEKQADEITWKRRLSETKMENKVLLEKNMELHDHVGDLEEAEEYLRHEMREMGKRGMYLRNELEDIRRAFCTANSRVSDLEFERELLMQRLDRMNVEHATEVARLRQEKDAMDVEMIEINCRVRILEQSMASRDEAFASLKSKFCENELHETERLPLVSGYETAICVNDGREVAFVHYDDPSLSCDCQSSCVLQTDDIDSADEASEIADEDDGAYVSPGGGTSCIEASWPLLNHEVSADPLIRSTDSPSLTSSICDSGLDSLGLNHSQRFDDSSAADVLPLATIPNAYRHLSQRQMVSLIPVSIRYLATKPSLMM